MRNETIGFLNWIARMSPPAESSFDTRAVLSQLTAYLNAADRTDDARNSAYIAIGLVVKSVNKRDSDIKLIMLVQEGPEVSQSERRNRRKSVCRHVC